jgi:hypothetical protein
VNEIIHQVAAQQQKPEVVDRNMGESPRVDRNPMDEKLRRVYTDATEIAIKLMVTSQ